MSKHKSFSAPTVSVQPRGKLFKRFILIGDPVYLETFLGLLATILGTMLLFQSHVSQLPALSDEPVLTHFAPLWVWGVALTVAGSTQLTSTFYEIRSFMVAASLTLCLTWVMMTAIIIYDGGMSVRPIAAVVTFLAALGEMAIHVWANKFFLRERNNFNA